MAESRLGGATVQNNGIRSSDLGSFGHVLLAITLHGLSMDGRMNYLAHR